MHSWCSSAFARRLSIPAGWLRRGGQGGGHGPAGRHATPHRGYGLHIAFASSEMNALGSFGRMTTSETPDVARLQRECDLYRRLLDLGRCDEPEPFLREAL